MLSSAQERLPEASFIKADANDWRPSERQDLIFANAVLQWLPNHEELFPSLLQVLASSGVLAIQMPDNLEEPCHRAMRKVASYPRWAHKMGPALAARAEIRSPASYYAMLHPLSRRVDIWRTTYHHPMPGAKAIVEWFRGSGMRPFLDLLSSSETVEFLAQYENEITEAYPEDSSGTSLLPFPRLFIVAVCS
jgi:trans-aconitate 2-methyltransferase